MQCTTNPTLSPDDQAFVDGPRFATLATHEPDGSTQLSVVWITREGGDLLMSTLHGRRKTRNLERDPRASVLIHDAENPYTYLEVRGEVEISEDPDGQLIDALSWKYHGYEFRGARPGDRRVVLRLRPRRVQRYG